MFNRLFLAAGMAAGICLTAGTVLAATAIAPGPGPVSISGDRGGQVIAYAMKTAQFRKSGRLIRIKGRCDSACTLYLSLPRRQLCVTPGAAFRFHAPFGASRKGNAQAARYLMRKYPGWVRSFIASRGGLSGRLITMNYAYASRYLPTCRTA